MGSNHPSNPKVSILMSVYNGANYISIALDSILHQTLQQFEFIIIDDGSNDRTGEIVSDYAKNDVRIKLIRNDQNIGLTRSLNKGLAIACAKYIARQDADDISLPERLEKQSRYLDEHDDIVLIAANFNRIDSKDRLIRRIRQNCESKVIEWFLLFYNYLEGHSQVMFRREAALSVGGYSETYDYAQDYELWTRLLAFGQIKILKDVLIKYRIHANALSKRHTNDQLNFALMTSQNQIYQLIGERLCLPEVAQLWSFWTLTPLPREISVGNELKYPIDARLKQIYKKFLLQHRIVDQRIRTRLVLSIGERYVKWFLFELIKNRSLAEALHMLKYAFYWLGYRLIYIFPKICVGKIMTLCRTTLIE